MTDPDIILRSGGSKRHRAESRFKAYGMIAIAISLGFLLLMIGSIVLRGTGAFQQTFVQIEITLPAEKLDPEGTRDPLRSIASEIKSRLTLHWLAGRTLSGYVHRAT